MLSDMLRSSRPVSWINTAYPFAVAYFVVAQTVDAALIIGTVFFLIPYNLAMYGINDVFDYASDSANPRKGGAEGALLAPRLHKPVLVASAGVCLPFVVALLLLGTWQSWMVLGISLFAVVAYSAPPMRFKEVPFLDSLTSSVHFVSPAAYGLVLAGASVEAAVFGVLGAFLLWGWPVTHLVPFKTSVRTEKRESAPSLPRWALSAPSGSPWDCGLQRASSWRVQGGRGPWPASWLFPILRRPHPTGTSAMIRRSEPTAGGNTSCGSTTQSVRP